MKDHFLKHFRRVFLVYSSMFHHFPCSTPEEYHPEAPVLTPEVQEEMLIDPMATGLKWLTCGPQQPPKAAMKSRSEAFFGKATVKTLKFPNPLVTEIRNP